ncbi:MAG: hypothetical protein J5682_08090 [Prevotella sp.]|nr:hypothetical protein [Prevotella sp.]
MIRAIIPMTRRGDVTIHADGRIDLSAHVSELLHLSDGDILNIAVTDDPVKEYYLYVVHRGEEVMGRHACRCHSVKGRGRYMRMFSKRLAGYLLREVHACESVTFRAGETVEVAPIGLAMVLVYGEPKTTTYDHEEL